VRQHGGINLAGELMPRLSVTAMRKLMTVKERMTTSSHDQEAGQDAEL
jgi:hypothetical protein